MFSLFRKNYAVGVDIGTSSIKVVELSLEGNKAHLINYGTVALDFGGASKETQGGLSFESRRSVYFSALLKKIGIKNPEAIYVSMPGFSGLVSLVEFPEMKEQDLAQAVQFEARKYVPVDMSEVALSWDIVKRDHGAKEKSVENTSRKIEVLMVAALRKDVAQVERLFVGTPYKLKAIELETFSLARSLIEDETKTYLIIDIGFKVCNFVLVQKGIVRANRNIDVGGNEITSTIADSMSIAPDRAEQLKKSGKDFFHANELSVFFPSLDFAVNEAQRVLSAFREKKPDAKVDQVILSGGSSGLRGIDRFFAQKLQIETVLGDPWKRVSYGTALSPFVKEMNGAFSVAIGLALRGIEEYKRS